MSRGGGLIPPHSDTWDAMVNGQQAGGTYPTGMLSFFILCFNTTTYPCTGTGPGMNDLISHFCTSWVPFSIHCNWFCEIILIRLTFRCEKLWRTRKPHSRPTARLPIDPIRCRIPCGGRGSVTWGTPLWTWQTWLKTLLSRKLRDAR